MDIEGFVNYHSPFIHESQGKEGVIVWNNGYIKLSVKTSEIPFKVLIGVEKDKEVKSLGSLAPKGLTSFFEFRSYLEQANGELDIGIWVDVAANQLCFARHLFGMCPIYYMHIPHQFLAFSTNLATLVRMQEVKPYVSIDRNRIINYTTFRADQSTDYSEDTFYQNIKSALPGQLLSLAPNDKSYATFTKFRISEWSDLNSVPEYAEAFRGLLTESVQKNTSDPSQLLGSHLSGGLDSSSISSIAKLLHPERPLHTFYYSTRAYKTDDNLFARDVARDIGSFHHELVQPTDDLAIVRSNTTIYGRPLASPISPSSEAAVMRLAKELKCNVLMNGSDGDSIVGSGLELPELLWKNRDWNTLKKLLRERVKYFSLSHQYKNWETLTFEQQASIVEQNFIYNRLTAQVRRAGLLSSYQTFKEVSKHFDISMGYFTMRIAKALKAKVESTSIQPVTLLRDDFKRANFAQKPTQNKLSVSLRGDLSADYQQWFEDVFNHHSIALNEERFALTNYYGFKNSSPFYDKRLFELCISIPAIVKFGNGQGRAHFREAMKGILPEHVRTRHQKATVGSFGKEVTLRLYEQSRELLTDSNEVWTVIDKEKFADTMRFLQTEGLDDNAYNRTLFHVTRTISLAAWFEWLKSNDIPIRI
ncbi:asparagine synthase-related protein [Dyadobacter sp. CY326]|uniref:asparagine synthase-related protein n=1 Tax=Dyadobacter sp. CY326 TaxID=2907300 RepID=UPI001F3366AE|nr:asparagine synthase-related protein [Dyadobacter sp. CY326]MCE7065321.1 asparagine synthase-related protein [Dyadobacter sp. CY326]